MPERDDFDRQQRRTSDQPEFRDMVREIQELSRRVTILETRLDLQLKGISDDMVELKKAVAGCATKEQLKPAVWLLGIIGSSGIGAFVLALWNVILKRPGP